MRLEWAESGRPRFSEVAVETLAIASGAGWVGRGAGELARIGVVAVDVAGSVGIGVEEPTGGDEDEVAAIRGCLGASADIAAFESAEESGLAVWIVVGGTP